MSLLDTASLIVTPNGYKEGKLYSVIPSDGSGDLSVTRATTATRVNSAGLVELVPYNLLDYTERLDVPSWYKYFTYVNANVAIAPDGTLTADEVVITTTGGSVYKSPFDYNSGVFTISGYFKKNTASSVVAISSNPTSGYFAADYDLDTEVITPYGTIISSNIENVGNGWFRCSLTANVSGTGYVAYGVNGSAGGQSNFVWGVQINEGTLKPYQKTETRLNIPRLDYSNGTCPSLLVEPQRTNIATYSEDFSAVGFTIDSSLSSNTTTAPSGIQSADSLIENTANGNHLYYIDYSVSSGTTYTYSVFCKSIGGRNVEIRSTNAFSEERAIINLSNGSIFSESTSQIAVEPYGNGWYRISITKLASTSTGRFIIFALDGTSLAYQGNGTSGLYLWGAQLEAGSYATSYIPTTSASVTRNADVISKTGISSLIGQTEGTLFIDTYIDNIEARSLNVLSYLKGASVDKYIGISNTGGVSYVDYPAITISSPSFGLTNGRHKFAIAYKTNDFAFYIDGVQVGTASSGVPSACSEFGYHYYASGYDFPLGVNSTALWKTRLTNTQLAQLTSI